MTRNNLLSEKLNYTGASHTPTHLHFCTYNTEILEYRQGASIKEFAPFIRPDERSKLFDGSSLTIFQNFCVVCTEMQVSRRMAGSRIIQLFA